MPLPLRHSASEQLKNDHCASARMRDMRLDESWTGSNLGPRHPPLIAALLQSNSSRRVYVTIGAGIPSE